MAKNQLAEMKASMQVYEIERRVPHPPKSNTRAKNIFFDLFTTRIPVKNEAVEHKTTSKGEWHSGEQVKLCTLTPLSPINVFTYLQ